MSSCRPKSGSRTWSMPSRSPICPCKCNKSNSVRLRQERPRRSELRPKLSCSEGRRRRPSRRGYSATSRNSLTTPTVAARSVPNQGEHPRRSEPALTSHRTAPCTRALSTSSSEDRARRPVSRSRGHSMSRIASTRRWLGQEKPQPSSTSQG